MISTLTSDEPIIQSLRYCMLLVGLRAQNMPGETETDVLMQFIRHHYANHTPLEIKIAFDLAVAGTLEVDVATYENFSCAYLAKIMTAYRKYAAVEYKHSKVPQKIAESAQNSIETVKTADWSEDWQRVVYGAKIGQIKNVWIPVDLYEWLIREKKIVLADPNDREAVQKEMREKWELVKQVAAQYLQDIKDALLTGNGSEPTYEIKRRITLLENTDKPIWKKDTVIMSTLTVMAKQEMVRQAAIKEALNEQE